MRIELKYRLSPQALRQEFVSFGDTNGPERSFSIETSDEAVPASLRSLLFSYCELTGPYVAGLELPELDGAKLSIPKLMDGDPRNDVAPYVALVDYESDMVIQSHYVLEAALNKIVWLHLSMKWELANETNHWKDEQAVDIINDALPHVVSAIVDMPPVPSNALHRLVIWLEEQRRVISADM